MHPKAYFKDIQYRILQELGTAKHTIHIAVAWFTDNVLYDALHNCALNGLQIIVLILKDDINLSGQKDIDRLISKGCFIRMVTNDKDLMHNKFCVIDHKTVITGSYNWTRSAHRNDENIIVVKDNFIFASSYLVEFYKIFNKYVLSEEARPEEKEISMIALKAVKELTLTPEQIEELEQLA